MKRIEFQVKNDGSIATIQRLAKEKDQSVSEFVRVAVSERIAKLNRERIRGKAANRE